MRPKNAEIAICVPETAIYIAETDTYIVEIAVYIAEIDTYITEIDYYIAEIAVYIAAIDTYITEIDYYIAEIATYVPEIATYVVEIATYIAFTSRKSVASCNRRRGTMVAIWGRSVRSYFIFVGLREGNIHVPPIDVTPSHFCDTFLLLGSSHVGCEPFLFANGRVA